MIPLKDDNPTSTYPFVTVGLIAIDILVYFYEISLGPYFEPFLDIYGAKPLFVLSMSAPPEYPAPYITIFTSMFLHGGFFHVAGNMLYLWIFGNNIEDSMGHIKFIIFYLLCGIVAVYTFSIINGMLSGGTRGGVAWFAHIGGFITGMVLISLFKNRKKFHSFNLI